MTDALPFRRIFTETVARNGGERMARNSVAFEPEDWRADEGIRRCTLAARGLWLEMLCVMWEGQCRASCAREAASR